MEEITRMPKSPDFVEGIINLRGQIIAVVELAKRLNLEAGERSGDTRIIVVEAEDIAAEIISSVRGSGADTVVMCTHGRGGLSRWLFGSVATRVLQSAPVPVLVVRPGGMAA